jgi:hypothetical protein
MPSSSSLAGPAPRRLPYSLLAILLLFVLMVQARFWAPYWDTRNVQAILTWDSMGYYLYLPAQFIYHDLAHLSFIPDIMREYGPSTSFYQAYPLPGAAADAPLVMKYTCGLAVLWFPFFWLGHWAAALFDYPQDGFSAPYQLAIALGSLLYALLGLGVLRRVLRRYFTDLATALVLVGLVLGTNYFQYAVFDAAMTHSPLFTLYALLLWLTIRWHEQPTLLRALAIGLMLGFLTLVRPSEMVAVVLPLLWGITSVATLRAKLQLLARRWPDVVLLALGGLVAASPQPLYWHWVSGHFFVYSYGDQHFSFFKPHLWSVLFSFRKGWLLYTPLMVLPIVGFAALWRQHRAVAVPTLAFFLLNLWVVSAWDIWWYGGSIGCRALVQSYAVLALPAGAAATWLLAPERRRGVQLAAVAGFVYLLNLNLFQHWQYMNTIIHPEDMTRRYYWAVFNNAQPTQSDLALLDVKTSLPRAEHHYHRTVVGTQGFEDQPAAPETGIQGWGYNSGRSFHLEPSRQYSPALTLPLAQAGLQPGDYIRASCMVLSDWGAWNDKLVMEVVRNGKSVAWNAVRLHNILCVGQRWNRIYFDVPLPDDALPSDILKIYAFSPGGSPCNIDELQAELFRPKN